MKGNGRIFQRGNVQWIAYYLRGREYRESAKTDDLEKAKRFLKHRVKEVSADQIGAKTFVTPQMQRATVGELLDSLTRDLGLRSRLSTNTKSLIKIVRAHFGEWRASAVTADHTGRYVQSLLAEGYSKASANRRTEILGLAYKLAIRERRLTEMPYIAHLSEIGNERVGFFEQDEFELVHEHLPDDLKDYCRFCYVTGWRKTAVQKLEWSDVDDRVVYLRAIKSKNRKPVTWPLVGVVAEIISRRRAAQVLESPTGEISFSKYVFHRQGERIGDFRKSWTTALRKAGLGHRLVHDFCRSAAKNLVEAGVPESVAMSLMGRRTNSIFKRYAITSEEQKGNAALLTENYLRVKIENKKLALLQNPAAMVSEKVQ
jgi:integrase